MASSTTLSGSGHLSSSFSSRLRDGDSNVQLASPGSVELHRPCRRDVDRLAVDHPVPPVGGNERAQLVALANAACVSIDERVDLVATVEPDVGGVEVLPAKGMDDAIDVIAVDVGDDHDVELRGSPAGAARCGPSPDLVLRAEPAIDEDPMHIRTRPVLHHEAVAACRRKRGEPDRRSREVDFSFTVELFVCSLCREPVERVEEVEVVEVDVVFMAGSAGARGRGHRRSPSS